MVDDQDGEGVGMMDNQRLDFYPHSGTEICKICGKLFYYENLNRSEADKIDTCFRCIKEENRMKNIKVGDVVHVRALVLEVPETTYPIVQHNGVAFRLLPDGLVHVEPRPLKVGDKVRHKPSNLAGVIKAICDDLAWLEIYSAIKDFRTIYMRDLELIND